MADGWYSLARLTEWEDDPEKQETGMGGEQTNQPMKQTNQKLITSTNIKSPSTYQLTISVNQSWGLQPWPPVHISQRQTAFGSGLRQLCLSDTVILSSKARLEMGRTGTLRNHSRVLALFFTGYLLWYLLLSGSQTLQRLNKDGFVVFVKWGPFQTPSERHIGGRVWGLKQWEVT